MLTIHDALDTNYRMNQLRTIFRQFRTRPVIFDRELNFRPLKFENCCCSADDDFAQFHYLFTRERLNHLTTHVRSHIFVNTDFCDFTDFVFQRVNFSNFVKLNIFVNDNSSSKISRSCTKDLFFTL